MKPKKIEVIMSDYLFHLSGESFRYNHAKQKRQEGEKGNILCGILSGNYFSFTSIKYKILLDELMLLVLRFQEK